MSELRNERLILVNSLNANSLNIKQNTMTNQPLFSVLIANYNGNNRIMHYDDVIKSSQMLHVTTNIF